MDIKDYSSEADASDTQGFWAYHFSCVNTKKRRVFDVLFGIIVPILCFVFDPMVFGSSGNPRLKLRYFSELKFLVYFFCALSIINLLVWLVFEKKLTKYGNIFGGLLWSSSIGAFLIGVLILPITLFGLLFLIGVFGFIPFVTAFVYLRNGAHAFQSTTRPLNYFGTIATLILCASFMFGVSTLVHLKCNTMLAQSLQLIVTDEPTESAIRVVKYLASTEDADAIVWAYSKEKNPKQRGRMGIAYYKITGNDIQIRLDELES
jgi:hypothetical protein